ncbi:MAG: hypothetical protein OQJ89_04330 [Kangiellaceae bacterium]|nr:hypothetical protein [Kangiellaceae bacterium]MCW8997249.1 hypothetical protein [Kangiellaceae bacterium]MCW9016169.1 hypothetical protein [Kangiellaceae bacterium]
MRQVPKLKLSRLVISLALFLNITSCDSSSSSNNTQTELPQQSSNAVWDDSNWDDSDWQ